MAPSVAKMQHLGHFSFIYAKPSILTSEGDFLRIMYRMNEKSNTPLLWVNNLEVKMNTPVWRGLAQTGVFNSIKICVISHVTAVGISLAASFRHQIIGEYMLRLLMQSALNYHFDINKGKNENIISLRLIIFTSLYTFSIMILAMI